MKDKRLYDMVSIAFEYRHIRGFPPNANYRKIDEYKASLNRKFKAAISGTDFGFDPIVGDLVRCFSINRCGAMRSDGQRCSNTNDCLGTRHTFTNTNITGMTVVIDPTVVNTEDIQKWATTLATEAEDPEKYLLRISLDTIASFSKKQARPLTASINKIAAVMGLYDA